MFKVVFLTIFQSFLLASGQVFFKLAVTRIGKLHLSFSYLWVIITNWWLLASGICLILATILWAYIIKSFPFSIAYPITAFAYVFGMLAARFIFREPVSILQWFGLMLILLGIFLIAK